MDILPLFPQAVLGLNKLNVSSEEILDYLKKLSFSETEATEKNQSLSFRQTFQLSQTLYPNLNNHYL